MEYIVKCEKCKNEHRMADVQIKEQVIKIDNKKLTVVYYRCPSCDELFIVGLLDFHANKLKEKCERQYARIKQYEQRGQVCPLAIKKEYERCKQVNISHQKSMIDQYKERIPRDVLK